MEQEARRRWAKEVADTLRAERGISGLSQAAIERKAMISRSSYRLYEEAERQPNTVQLAQIAEALGIPVSRLFDEIERRAQA